MLFRAQAAPLLLSGFFLFTSFASGPPALAAQTSPLTPADSAAVLVRTAVLFEEQGDWSVAEALYLHVLERFGATPGAAIARERLSGAGAAAGSRSGRVELQVFGTTYGLWLGDAVPAAFGADGSEPYGVGLLAGGPLGLVAARAVTKNRSLSAGQTRAITWGGTWGTWQGFGWANVLDLGETEVCDQFGCYDSGDPDPERFAAMIAGGLVGIATGALLARQPIDWGVATAANHGSLWGSWLGVAANVLLDIEDDRAMASALLFGNGGLAVSALLASRYDLSRNRVRLITVGGLIGGLGGAGIDLIIQPDDEKAAIAVPLVGSLIGLAVGAHATRDSDRGAGAADQGQALGSLLGYRDGGWSLDAPLPAPTLVPVDDATGRTRWRPGVAVELLRVSLR